jgi:2-polyprenyl-6-methoxyphenol hydroxylase-like FAD-dependent oxidoreductase
MHKHTAYDGNMSAMLDAQCCIVGGGPAGMVLGLMLARGGIRTVVLEKHGDFLRDFRGDTVHASTLTLLDELGLGEQFAALPARWVEHITVQLDSGTYAFADLTRIPGPHRHIAFVPQWDFLDLLADAGRDEPNFELRMNAEVTDLLVENGRVRGVTYRHGAEQHDLDAPLVVACDGRSSTVRQRIGLAPREFGAPMDVLWFRLPRQFGDPEGGFGRLGRRLMVILIDRGDYFQVGVLIKKNSYEEVRAAGIESFHERLASALPWLGDRVASVTSFEDIRLLTVQLSRLRRWYMPGLLCIGDAAHAMSPVGGVGINLAVHDAVAAARILAPILAAGFAPTSALRRVQIRRWFPTAVTQTFQRLAHHLIVASAVSDTGGPAGPAKAPAAVKLLQRWPVLQVIPAAVVAIGILPEHAPDFARRAAPKHRSTTPTEVESPMSNRPARPLR